MKKKTGSFGGRRRRPTGEKKQEILEDAEGVRQVKKQEVLEDAEGVRRVRKRTGNFGGRRRRPMVEKSGNSKDATKIRCPNKAEIRKV